MNSEAKGKKWLGYSLYVILVTIMLLYLLFPTKAVEEFVDRSISRINSDLGFMAQDIGPWIPAGLRIKEARIFLSDAAGPAVFVAESLYLGPRILKMLKGEYSIELSGKAYKGKMQGSLHADKEGNISDSELSFQDFDLAENGFLIEKLKHKLTGKFSGDIVYTKDSAGAAGSGKADLRLKEGQLQFQTPIFNIASVDLQNIDLEMELRDREVTIVSAELAGPELKASMTGSIQLQADLKRSQLNLKGTLEPLAEFYKNYPEIRELLKSMKKRVKRGQYFFAITGTLDEPRFRLL